VLYGLKYPGMSVIHKNISIEQLTEEFPFSVDYLSKNGIRCIVCGEPIWGTLQEAAEEKGFTEADINRFVAELIELANNKSTESPYAKRIDVGKI